MTTTSSRLLVFQLSIAICLFLAFPGRAYHSGAAGAVADDFVPGAQGEEQGRDPDPAVFTKALECFNDRYIYSSCDEAYRVSQKGELDVPHEYTDQYCDGPCVKETALLLDCIEQVLKHFRFYNKATVHDVRQTLLTGCSYGPRRGDFDVAKQVEVDEDIASKLSTTSVVVYATVLMIMAMGWHALF